VNGHRANGMTGLAGLLVASSLMAGCAPNQGTPGATQRVSPPISSGQSGSIPSQEASPSAVLTEMPTSVASAPTPPAAGQPWGGLVWSDPVPVAWPWGHRPKVLMAWRGGYIGLDLASPDGVTGEPLVAGTSDLVHWNALSRGSQTPFTANELGLLYVGADGLMAIGANGGPTSIWTSPDGASWTRRVAAPFGDRGVSIAFGDDGFVAVGSRDWQDQMVWRSADGLDWHADAAAATAFKGAKITGIYERPGGFLVAGNVGGGWAPDGVIGDPGGRARVWWSENGSTWEQANLPENHQAMFVDDLLPVARGFVATGFRAGAWRSSDGKTWQNLPTSLWNDNQGRPWFYGNGSQLLSVGVIDDAEPWTLKLWCTVDGSSWHEVRQSGSSMAAGIFFNDEYLFMTPSGVVAFGSGSVMMGRATP
jgi:hypothetical protein